MVEAMSVHCLPLSFSADALFADWSFPNLRNLFLSGLTPSIPAPLLQRLTTLRLCGIDGGVDVPCSAVLSRLLTSTPALQRLSFACSVSSL